MALILAAFANAVTGLDSNGGATEQSCGMYLNVKVGT